MIRSAMRCVVFGILVALSVCSASGMAWATATGLNNIPTADVVPAGVLVLQQITNFGSDQETLVHLGLKAGPAENWEIGFDKRIHASGSGSGVAGAGGLPAGPWVFQAKYRYAAPDGNTAAALGVANVGEDSDRSGDAFPYFVVSHDAGPARLHGGYSWQSNNPA
ncbi:MAG: hypothetical protein GTN78_11930, partial [Gemmatimonadales bacterium]|nr:hypothetical protein [Gemmatimonadales bacterium]